MFHSDFYFTFFSLSSNYYDFLSSHIILSIYFHTNDLDSNYKSKSEKRRMKNNNPLGNSVNETNGRQPKNILFGNVEIKAT